uniref:Uncharacterized protein n=1 Tax=Panagrolaimus davidi TaxID=227884 RepID=A0A914QY87_9BILA
MPTEKTISWCKKQKAVELIAFDKNHNLEFQDSCKLIINFISKTLTAEPKNKEFEKKSALFKQKFFSQKNILFIFGENEYEGFVLVFAKAEMCKKIFDLINGQKEEQNYIVTEEMLEKNFLIPIFKRINDKNFAKTKKIFNDWILCNDKIHQEKYLNLMNKWSEEGYNGDEINAVDQEIERAGQKRKRHERIANRNSKKNKNETYFCYQCRKQYKQITAIMGYDDEKNEEYVKLINKEHFCEPLPYNPEKYTEIITLKKPEYQFFDNCSTFTRKILFIFHPSNPNLCYKYFWKTLEGKFYCCGCHVKKKATAAEIFNENKENEFIRLLHTDHICEYINYEPEKYTSFNNFVVKPDFEIQTKITNGNRKLIIFDKNDRNLCYIYYDSKRGFMCVKCNEKNKTVFAKLCQNSEGEEYVILSNAPHVCTPRKYIPQPKSIILRPPNVELILSKEGQKMLYVYTSNDRSQCYLFKPVRKNDDRLGCNGCSNLLNNRNRKRKSDEIVDGKVVHAYLFKDDNSADKYYVRMIKDQKHLCKPQKTSATKVPEPITIQSNEYFLFKQKFRNKEFLYLGIYLKDDKKLCYKYCYDSKSKLFVCGTCHSSEGHIRVTAKLQQNSEGNEFILASGAKHICKPNKVSTTKQMKGITILEKSGLNFDENVKKKKPIEEKKILKPPNFELHRSVTGVKDGKLVVFKEDDKNLCYNYFFNKHDSSFLCAKCSKMKNRVRADLRIDEESGEKFVELGKNEHCCDPVKYEPEKELIEDSNFMVVNRESKTKPTKLIIFTSPSKEFCYEYVLKKSRNIFSCYACEMLKRFRVSAKIHNNENGQEFVQLLKNEHICQPKIFKTEKNELKILSKSQFFLRTNLLGKENSKMVVFDQEKKGYCYEYHKTRNLFHCTKCLSKFKKHTTAKLSEDGEQLELASAQHLCKSIEFYPEKYEENVILSDEKFSLLYNTSGEPLSKLIIFDSNDKNSGYEYSYLKAQKLFYCLGCDTKEKHVAAKLFTDENGEYSIKMRKQKHVCKARNFKEMNKIFEVAEFELNENEIIVKHSTEKNCFYKFAFDNETNAFCCIPCKSKDRFLEAKLCIDKNEKEFLILNGSHRCTPLRKKTPFF